MDNSSKMFLNKREQEYFDNLEKMHTSKLMETWDMEIKMFLGKLKNKKYCFNNKFTGIFTKTPGAIKTSSGVTYRLKNMEVKNGTDILCGNERDSRVVTETN